MNEDLTDELSALNSIYGDSSIIPSPSGPNSTYILQPPLSIIAPQINLYIEFPDEYPKHPPKILDAPVGGNGVGVELARDVLVGVYREGEVCVYDLVEGLREVMGFEDDQEGDVDVGIEGGNQSGSVVQTEAVEEPLPPLSPSVPIISTPENNPPVAETISKVSQLPWAISTTFVEKKSVFVARAIAVYSVEDAKCYLSELISSDKKIAKATHNITAWRIKRHTDNVTFQDNDDDGETAAGSRLGHLLQVMDVWNVMVVVSRWYGGVKLGPDRFRLINTTARDALVRGGFVANAADGGAHGANDAKKSGKKGKK